MLRWVWNSGINTRVYRIYCAGTERKNHVRREILRWKTKTRMSPESSLDLPEITPTKSGKSLMVRYPCADHCAFLTTISLYTFRRCSLSPYWRQFNAISVIQFSLSRSKIMQTIFLKNIIRFPYFERRPIYIFLDSKTLVKKKDMSTLQAFAASICSYFKTFNKSQM